MRGVVQDLKLIEDSGEYQLLRIDIGIDSYYLFGDYNKYIILVGKDVIFTTRQELINKEFQEVIVSIAERTVIQTIDKEAHIAKLIPQSTERAVCNFAISSLRLGDADIGCIALMFDYEEGSSSKAKWIDIKLIDIESKYFELRLFTKFAGQDWKSDMDLMKGKYVKFDVRSTKYGYQTNEISLVSHEVVVPPEVEVAYKYILDYLDKDEELSDYCTSTGLIEHLKEIFYYEKGYHLVELASELMIADTIDSITDTYDNNNLKRLCVVTRGYLLPRVDEFSKPVANSIIMSGTGLRLNKELMQAVDSPNEGSRELKQVYSMIRSMSKFIIHKRKGDEDASQEVLNSFANSFILSTTSELLF